MARSLVEETSHVKLFLGFLFSTPPVAYLKLVFVKSRCKPHPPSWSAQNEQTPATAFIAQKPHLMKELPSRLHHHEAPVRIRLRASKVLAAAHSYGLC